MGRPQWKRAESRAAKLFGTVRRPLSGGNQSGGLEGPRDDAQHEVLHLETKSGASVAPWSLYKRTARIAAREGRVPVLVLQQHREHGLLVCINSQHMEAVIREWCKANGFELLPKETTPKSKTSTQKTVAGLRKVSAVRGSKKRVPLARRRPLRRADGGGGARNKRG